MEEDKALMELHEKLEMGHGFLGMVAGQTGRAQMNIKRAGLTLAEVTALPEDVRTFKPVGKAYFLAPKAEMEQELRDDVAAAKDDLDKLTVQREHAEKSIQETENEIRELFKQNPQRAAAFQRMMAAGS